MGPIILNIKMLSAPLTCYTLFNFFSQFFLKKSKRINKLIKIKNKKKIFSLLKNQVLFGMETYQDYNQKVYRFLNNLIKLNHIYYFYFIKNKKISKIIQRYA